ncbi:MAG TPA: hypothetical protein VGW12_20070 [Pyrinomonadaceae bacterium]|nr:hypothetical protein [Pyrinomonadaceae bacterium]
MVDRRFRFSIESIEKINAKKLYAHWFINPTIALLESYKQVPFPFEVKCERIKSSRIGQGEVVQVEIHWRPDTFPNSERLLKTIQREVIVEHSAVAIAFLLVTEIASCKVTEVTLRGDKADYFLNGRKIMLEVSGTENAGKSVLRHREKCEQLLSNPYGKGGYVVICCFSNNMAIFSFHLPPKKAKKQ